MTTLLCLTVWLTAAGLDDGLLVRVSGDGPGAALASGPGLAGLAGAEGASFVPGRHGQAVRPRPGEALSVRLAEPLPTAAGSLAVWFQPERDAATADDQVICFTPGGTGAAPNANWQIRLRAGGTLLVRAGAMGLAETELGPLQFAAGDWVHLAVTWTAQRLTCYVDGLRAAVVLAADGETPRGRQVVLGSMVDGSFPATAALDEFRLYDRELSAAEVAELAGGSTGSALGPAPTAPRAYARRPPVPPRTADPDLLARFSFDEPRQPWLRPFQTAPRPTEGKVGGALAFTAGGFEVTLAEPFPAKAGAVACWVRPEWGPDVSGSRVIYHVAVNGGDSTDNYHVQVWQGTLSVRAGSMRREGRPAADVSVRDLAGWEPGKWRHLAVCWDETRLTVYLDGEVAGEVSPVAYPYPPSDVITIGAWPGGNRHAGAALDEFHIFRRPLTAAEVARLAAGQAW